MAGVWTLNWKATKNALLCSDWIEGLSAPRDENGNYRYTLTTTVNYHGGAGLWPGLKPLNTSEIVLGSGSTVPAETDYRLATPLSGVSHLSIVNEKPTWSASTGVVSNTVILTVQNTNAEAVTVREWGIRGWFGTAEIGAGWFLFYRAVLDSPVTIQPNQSATLTLSRGVTLTDPVVWPAQ
jgi:hypothetical protein